MRIRKTGWVIWDKEEKKVESVRDRFVYSSKQTAWLSAGKERKGSPYKVVAVSISIKK